MNIQFFKSIIIVLFFFFLPFGERWGGFSYAQSSVSFDAGQAFTTYKFVSSQGTNENDFTKNISGCFSLGYQNTWDNGLFIRINAGMRKAGASLIYNEMNVNWNVQYADANVGLGYIIKKWRFKPYLSASPYFGYMLRAYQTIGQDTYDIMKNNSMQTTDYGVFFTPGFKVTVSNYFAFYAEYKYILGLQNLEKSSDQKSYNAGFSVSLGVSYTFIKYNYVTSQKHLK